MLAGAARLTAAVRATAAPAGRVARWAVMSSRRGETPEERKARKEAVKQQKAARRAQREGAADEDVGRKQCTLCGELRDTLIRCQVDASAQWHMVCGRCWKEVSGGVVDGDAAHPHYRYGGLWRNLRQPK